MYKEKKIHLGAIIAGVIFDIIGTIIFEAVFAFIAAIPYANTGLGPAEIELQLRSSALFQLFNICNGLFFTAMGGYIAARIAGFAQIKHAVLTGTSSILIALIFLIFIPGATLGWYELATLFLMLPAAALGGHIRRSFLRKGQTRTQETP